MTAGPASAEKTSNTGVGAGVAAASDGPAASALPPPGGTGGRSPSIAGWGGVQVVACAEPRRATLPPRPPPAIMLAARLARPSALAPARRAAVPRRMAVRVRGAASADVDGAMLEPSLANNPLVRVVGLAAAAAGTAAASAAASPAVGAVAAHLLSFAFSFGAQFYTTFFLGIAMFKNLPRQSKMGGVCVCVWWWWGDVGEKRRFLARPWPRTPAAAAPPAAAPPTRRPHARPHPISAAFGRLQAKLFPLYFSTLTAAHVLMLATLALGPGLAQPQAVTLGVGLAATLANLLIVEPASTRSMFKRYALEGEGAAVRDEAAVAALVSAGRRAGGGAAAAAAPAPSTLHPRHPPQKKEFGKLHGLSSTLNLASLVCAVSHGVWLARALALPAGALLAIA